MLDEIEASETTNDIVWTRGSPIIAAMFVVPGRQTDPSLYTGGIESLFKESNPTKSGNMADVIALFSINVAFFSH